MDAPDPAPPPPSGGAPTRRSLPQRLLIGVNLAIVALCATASAAVAYGWWRFGQVERVAIDAGVLDDVAPAPPTTVPDEEEPALPEPSAPPPAQNWLLVGSDSRAFVQDGDEAESFGDTGAVEGQRSDTIMVVRLEPSADRVALLSIPRDLWVTVQPSGRQGRINTAFEEGPGALVQTIQEELGVPIHHYAQVDFQGFRELVDVLGGVEVLVERPVRDRDANGGNPTGLDIRATGCVPLSGDQALAYVRARHVQHLVDGRWVPEPGGDLDRVRRQQRFLRQAVAQASDAGLLDPRRIDALVRVGVEHVALDPDVGMTELLQLARAMATTDPAAIEGHSLPVDFTWRGRASVLELREAEAGPVLERFRTTPPPPAPPPPAEGEEAPPPPAPEPPPPAAAPAECR